MCANVGLTKYCVFLPFQQPCEHTRLVFEDVVDGSTYVRGLLFSGIIRDILEVRIKGTKKLNNEYPKCIIF